MDTNNYNLLILTASQVFELLTYNYREIILIVNGMARIETLLQDSVPNTLELLKSHYDLKPEDEWCLEKAWKFSITQNTHKKKL